MKLQAFRLLVITTCAAALVAGAVVVDVPAGAVLHVRLTKPVASNASRKGDPIEAVLIAPTACLEAGAMLRGRVDGTDQASAERARLDLKFSEIIPAGDTTVEAGLRLFDVDNARESVDESGRVIGILKSETFAAQLDRGIEKLSQLYPDVADLLQIGKNVLIKEADPEISYAPGVEMNLLLTRPFSCDDRYTTRPENKPESRLAQVVRSLPLRTMAASPSLPSDFTNLTFIGSRQQIEEAFLAAGWKPAASLNPNSVLETAKAIIESRGYSEAPVSTLLLEGRPPQMVFQKVNNTFAMRHHLRIWPTAATYAEREVWVGAATHDVGIDLSPETHTFFHKIDPAVDKERTKIVNDLVFTKMATLVSLVDRPGVPHESTNATGDRMVSDGQMAVIQFGSR